MKVSGSHRRYDLDRIRILTVLCVLFFHGLHIFLTMDWLVVSKNRSVIATHVVGYLDTWLMPLLFVVAGAGAWHSIRQRTWWGYIQERARRLLIPLYGIGVLFVIWPMFLVQEISHGRYEGTAWSFFLGHFGLNEQSSFLFLTGVEDVGHLWFLYSLFFISCVSLPAMKAFENSSASERLAALSIYRGGLLLIVVPLWLLKVALCITFNGNFDWAEQAHYAFFFLIGYIIQADDRIGLGLQRDWSLGLGLAVSAYVLLAIAAVTDPQLMKMMTEKAYSPGALAFVSFATSAMCWGTVLAALGFTRRYFNKNASWITYGNDAALPFYVFHMLFMVLIAFWVVPWGFPLWLEYLIVVGTTGILTLALYHILFRANGPARSLLGMKALRY